MGSEVFGVAAINYFVATVGSVVDTPPTSKGATGSVPVVLSCLCGFKYDSALLHCQVNIRRLFLSHRKIDLWVVQLLEEVI